MLHLLIFPLIRKGNEAFPHAPADHPSEAGAVSLPLASMLLYSTPPPATRWAMGVLMWWMCDALNACNDGTHRTMHDAPVSTRTMPSLCEVGAECGHSNP